MKLTEFLADVGPPVAYFPRLRALTGSTNATLLLCQLIYWHGKQQASDGWLFKRAEIDTAHPEEQSIEGETGLSYKEQIRARRLLREQGFLRENYHRTEHRLYFQLDLPAVNAAWEHLTSGHMPKGKVAHDQKSPGTLPSVSSLIGTTETTPQRTTEREPKAVSATNPSPTDPEREGEDAGNRAANAKCFRGEFGTPSPAQEPRLVALESTYGADRVHDAIFEASATHPRGELKSPLRYIETILKRWARQGPERPPSPRKFKRGMVRNRKERTDRVVAGWEASLDAPYLRWQHG